MSKIIFFVIIITLIGVIIYLIKSSVNTNATVNENNKKRRDLDDLIEEITEAIKISEKEAREGIEGALQRKIEFEAQLEQAIKLSEKLN